ncbi:MAG: UvrB/UvrC motif-containing protein [Planctomycetota bacterium]
MDCDDCQVQKTVHLTKIVNGQLESRHVCADCPRLQLGQKMLPSAGPAPFSLETFLAGIQPAKPRPATVAATPTCGRCGLSFDEFRQSGRLGCHHDYEAFQPGLFRLLRKIHGATQHVGRVPERIGERLERAQRVEGLRAELAEAVALEDYEQAAVLRDQIKELES